MGTYDASQARLGSFWTYLTQLLPIIKKTWGKGERVVG